MRWLGKITALVLLALWVPVTTHCTLEQLTGSALLSCCCEEDAEPAPDADCHQQVCGSLESGLLKSEDGRVWVLVPEPACLSWSAWMAHRNSQLLRPAPSHTSPPIPPSPWPRWLRTVQPPHGPDAFFG